MKKSRFTEQQIAFALQQAEGGTHVEEICRTFGISDRRRATSVGTSIVSYAFV